MKKIKLRNGLSSATASAILLSIFAIFLVGLFIFLLTLEDFSIVDAWPVIFLIIVIIFSVVLVWREKFSSTEEYVSEFVITDDKLVLVYKNVSNGCETRNLELDLDSIKNFHIKLIVDRYRSYNVPCIWQKVLAEIRIETTDNDAITLDENLSSSFSFCNYKFMLELLDISECIPNFSYEVTGNFIGAQADINHYAKFKKRLSFAQREVIVPYKNAPINRKILAFTIFILYLMVLGTFVYFCYPR